MHRNDDSLFHEHQQNIRKKGSYNDEIECGGNGRKEDEMA
jgi:hypothetical protein